MIEFHVTKLSEKSAVTVAISSSRRLTRPFFLDFLLEIFLGVTEDTRSPGLLTVLLSKARKDRRNLFIRELEVEETLGESLEKLFWSL